MKAISLWQPWASFVADGYKQYETRSWSTSYRGLLAIHATKRWTEEERVVYKHLTARFDLTYASGDVPPLGAVLCVCRLTEIWEVRYVRPYIDDMERAMGNYGDGRYAWHLEIVAVPNAPIPAKGAQGLWNWTPPVSLGVALMLNKGTQP